MNDEDIQPPSLAALMDQSSSGTVEQSLQEYRETRKTTMDLSQIR